MEFAENQGIKVLCHGESCHGGTHRWSLPSRGPDGIWAPGEWTPTILPTMTANGHTKSGPPQGWHLTRDPAQWWDTEDGAAAYLAEWDGEHATHGDKIAVSRCRLLRELTHDELATLGIYLSGNHPVINREPTQDQLTTGEWPRTWIGGDAVVGTARIGFGILCIAGRAVVGEVFALARAAIKTPALQPRDFRAYIRMYGVRMYGGVAVYIVGDHARLGPEA